MNSHFNWDVAGGGGSEKYSVIYQQVDQTCDCIHKLYSFLHACIIYPPKLMELSLIYLLYIFGSYLLGVHFFSSFVTFSVHLNNLIRTFIYYTIFGEWSSKSLKKQFNSVDKVLQCTDKIRMFNTLAGFGHHRCYLKYYSCDVSFMNVYLYLLCIDIHVVLLSFWMLVFISDIVLIVVTIK